MNIGREGTSNEERPMSNTEFMSPVCGKHDKHDEHDQRKVRDVHLPRSLFSAVLF